MTQAYLSTSVESYPKSHYGKTNAWAKMTRSIRQGNGCRAFNTQPRARQYLRGRGAVSIFKCIVLNSQHVSLLIKFLPFVNRWGQTGKQDEGAGVTE